MKDEIQVTVKALLPTPQGVGVFLSDGSPKVIAIFVDPFVAAAIEMYARKLPKPRPLTHDLIVNLLAGLGARVTKVVINELKGETFFARIYLLQESEQGRHVIEIDARPSDSIAMAIQQQCPIFVRREVWEQAEDASWALSQASGQPPADGEDGGEAPEGGKEGEGTP